MKGKQDFVTYEGEGREDCEGTRKHAVGGSEVRGEGR